MNLSTQISSVTALRVLNLPIDHPDNWQNSDNLSLQRYQCDIELDGKKCTVEIVSNKTREQLAKTQSMAALFHGFGVDILSMKSFFDALNNQNEPFIGFNLLGAGSVFPIDFQFTPQNISKLYASIIQAVAPNALEIFGFGNSMGGMFMEGTRVMLEDKIKFHRCFINSMGTQVAGGSPTQKWPEPKTSAILYTALCLAARTGSVTFLSGLLQLAFQAPIIGVAARWLYLKNLYNTPSEGDTAHIEQMLLREAISNSHHSPISIMANMGAHIVLNGPHLFDVVDVESSWENFVGEKLADTHGHTIIASNTGDAVFSTEFERQLAQRVDSELMVIEGGSHLPDQATAVQLVNRMLEATGRHSDVIETLTATGSAHRRSA